MKISMWNLYNLLGYARMEASIRSSGATILYARLAIERDFRPNTVYVDTGSAYPGGHDVVIIHRNDQIGVDGVSLHEVFNRVATIVDRYSSWERRLTSAENQENGVQTMLESAHAFLPGAFLAMTSGGNILGLSCTNLSPLRKVWSEIEAAENLSYERMYTLEKYIDFSGFQPHTGLTGQVAKDGSFRYIYRSVDDDDQHYGFLIYAHTLDAPPGGAEVILEQLSVHITRYFFFHINKLNITSVASERLHSLLSGGGDTDEVRVFFRKLQWTERGKFLIIAVSSGQNSSGEVIKTARGLFSSPLFCAMDKDLVIMLNLHREKGFQNGLQSLLALKSGGYRYGVSNTFHYLFSAGRYCQQAIWELRRAEMSSESVSLAEDHALDFFYGLLDADPSSYCYIDRSLLALVTYDAAHGTEYYPTMRAYLLSFFHASEAAKMLHIHRNTLLYRVEQIRTIIDMTEFDRIYQEHDTDSLNGLQLSVFLLDRLRAQEVMGARMPRGWKAPENQ